MPLPSELHVDQALTNVSVAYRPEGFVASDIYMVVPVKFESDKFFKYTLANNFTAGNDFVRAPKTRPTRIQWGISSDSYKCVEYAAEDLIDDRERNNADPAVDLDLDTTEVLTSTLMLGQEKRVLDVVTSTSSITQNTTLSGTSQWSDFAGSDPCSDIETAKQTVHLNTGVEPNTIAMGRQVFDKLRNHPDILERIKYVQKGVTTLDLLAQVFGVEKVIVGKAQRNTAKEGQTATLSYLFGKDVLVYHKPQRPSLRQAALGILFVKENFKIERYRDEPVKSDGIRNSHIVDEKLVEEKCGYLIKSAVA